MSNPVKITEANSAREIELSTIALKNILYLYYEISSDCLPIGDWDRADADYFDPYRYLDIEYESNFIIRDEAELALLHEGSAVFLLCRLAQFYDLDESTGSLTMLDFCKTKQREIEERHLRTIAPELFRIHSVFESGNIVKNEYIQNAFLVAFTGNYELFIEAIKKVRIHVIGGVLQQRSEKA